MLQRYPNHAEVKGWADHAKMIQSKCSENPDPADFKADFAHWKDLVRGGLAVVHIAKMAAAAQDTSMAKMHAREVVTQFGRSLDRMGPQNWPADVQEFVKNAKAEMEKMPA